MLKALELVGFKSFADKTRFEFPPGITVIVGPNGSGKSNIVDAIKWVLGEQSVKSLRGSEMADVIFNGSGSRRAQNSAETTLTFDNRERLLPIDANEVDVTRRVYRSGEGEYLLNGQPCRLRDIRDLFAGTGVSTQAYSIIEQGKVDVLLSASARDRRLIFEEAAGISRFRAKKVEAQRRLERVDQNLLRLSDIVDEVENRLKVVRLQAAKARRYKSYVDRLQELRTQVGLADWRRLSRELAEFEGRIAALNADLASQSAAAETAETKSLSLSEEEDGIDELIRDAQRRLSDNRERIASVEATIEHQRESSRDLEQEIERIQRQVASLSTRAGDLSSLLKQTLAEVTAAEETHHVIHGQVADGERALTELTSQFDQLRESNEAHRTAHAGLLRRSGQLAGDVSALSARLAAADTAERRSGDRLLELAAAGSHATAEIAELEQRRQRVAADCDSKQQQWQNAREQLSALEANQAECQRELAHLRERYSGASERAVVLEELEQRQEGVSTGAKELLARAGQTSTGPLAAIRGLVADVLRAQVDTAPLVEVALGERAGYLVVDTPAAIQSLLDSQVASLSGRVGLISLPSKTSAAGDGERLEGRPGVLGRADSFVQCDQTFAPLRRFLLGNTWIVETLRHACELAATTPGRLTFVTLSGEMIASDGAIVVGPWQAAGGLISRRSELRALAERIAELAGAIKARQANGERIAAEIANQTGRVESLSQARDRAQSTLAELRLAIGAAEERRHQLARQQVVQEKEAAAAEQERRTAAELLEKCEVERAEVEMALVEAQTRLARDEETIQEIDRQRQRSTREATLAKVELAKSEQRLDHLRLQLRQMQQDQHERQRAVNDSHQQLSRSRQRAAEAQRLILQAETEVAQLFLEKERLAAESLRLSERKEELRVGLAALAADVQRIRATIRKCESEIHQQELAAGQLRHERSALADRLREDYNIELAELEHKETDEEQHVRAEVEEEIASLRRKITNVGSVNLEALGELEELETRFADLSAQFRDLSEAKKALEDIIERINGDSRRLFSETLETVRGHFQALFRKLFGGGQADIVMDEEGDILESGLEIVARPPGKEPRSISLLSGGEKTLTCVALLLAIFRSKPSPFCVLDEVDAALDEANIGRFVGVLQEFLAWTQFIVVTHSKKTMTCAGTLYGVTMQESGISKRVSVRFEDVSDTGEILRTRDETPAAPRSGDEPVDGLDETQAA